VNVSHDPECEREAREVSFFFFFANEVAAEEPDEDNMEEIETSNIIGSRTRGKNIDFSKANQELGEEDEEDDDEDFVDEDDQMKD
jgi:hypothetical protein